MRWPSREIVRARRSPPCEVNPGLWKFVAPLSAGREISLAVEVLACDPERQPSMQRHEEVHSEALQHVVGADAINDVNLIALVREVKERPPFALEHGAAPERRAGSVVVVPLFFAVSFSFAGCGCRSRGQGNAIDSALGSD